LRIGGIELLQSRELLGRARCKTRALLFPRRLRGQLAAHARAAGELGVRPDQRQLLIDARLLDRGTHRLMQVQVRAKRACRCGTLRYPGRAFKYARQRCNELGRWKRVELLQ